MRRRHQAIFGGLLALALTGVAIGVISLGHQQMPEVERLWPLALGVGAAIVAWVIQGAVAALLATPRIDKFKLGKMTRIYLSGAFVAGIAPFRGVEIPYEVYLLKRLGLSAGEGTTVVVAKGMLNVSVLLVGTAAILILAPNIPEIQNTYLLGGVLGVIVVWAAAAFLVRRRSAKKRGEEMTGWRKKVADFFRDVKKNFAMLIDPEHRHLLVYGAGLMVLYWAFRLSLGPLALMAAGWDGSWMTAVIAQVLVTTFILPLSPTPGASGAAELGFAAFLSAQIPEGTILSAVLIWRGLTHYLPVGTGAILVARQLWRGFKYDDEEVV